MDIKELVIKNRSCRGYDKGYKVSRDELLQLVDCARLTAASMSLQPLKYMLVTAGETADIVNANVKFAAQLPEENLPYEGEEPEAFVLVCQDLEINDNPERFMKDVGIVAQTITLKATEMGLAGCMIGNYNKTKLATELGLDSRYLIQLVISIGKSVEDIRIVEINPDESPLYYRKDGVHYVPKRKLDDIICGQ